VPNKILCKVVNVELKAETETDEMFAQITLQPDPDVSQTQSGLDHRDFTTSCFFVVALSLEHILYLRSCP
jgi:hypothetical protein